MARKQFNASDGYTVGTTTIISIVDGNGNITANTLSATGNVNFTGSNISLGNTASNTTVNGNLTANIIHTNGVYSNRTSVAVTTDTIIDTFLITDYRAAKYTIRASNDSGYQALEVLLLQDDINTIITVYGSLSTAIGGVDIVSLSSAIVSGNVNLLATGLSANTQINLIGTYVPD